MSSDEELDFSTTEEDIVSIRRSMEEFKNGNCMEVGEYFDKLHAELLAMKAEQERSAGLPEQT